MKRRSSAKPPTPMWTSFLFASAAVRSIASQRRGRRGVAEAAETENGKKTRLVDAEPASYPFPLCVLCASSAVSALKSPLGSGGGLQADALAPVVEEVGERAIE